MNETVRFERWKKGTYLVVRNDKGNFITYRKQKGSGVRTKEQAIKLYKKYGSFTENVVKLKGTKTTTIKDKSFISKRKIGKNTFVVNSSKPLKKYNKFQYITKIFWGDNRQVTTGYSNLNSNRLESVNRAISGAIKAGIITYDYKIELYDNNVGVAVSPNMQTRVMFEFKSEVMSYVKI